MRSRAAKSECPKRTRESNMTKASKLQHSSALLRKLAKPHFQRRGRIVGVTAQKKRSRNNKNTPAHHNPG